MSDCIFCKIISGEIPTAFLYEDEHCVAFHDIDPKARVHVLLVPKRHLVNLADPELSQDIIGHMMTVAPEVAQQAGLGKGFRLITNTGPDSGQEVMHLHLHILGEVGGEGWVGL